MQLNARNSTTTFNTPAGMALQNSEFNADGSIANGRQLPKNAGFGAATGAAAMRNLQLQGPLNLLGTPGGTDSIRPPPATI